MTSKVYEFVTYFVAMCNDKAYFSAAKYVMNSYTLLFNTYPQQMYVTNPSSTRAAAY